MKTIFNISKDDGKGGFLSTTHQVWLQKLQESGYRLTGSRRTVVEIVARSARALSPLEISDLARSHHAGLGLVTVYRTLE